MKRPLYADTLEMVANQGADYFYDSTFTTDMVDELQMQYNAIVTKDDFINYKPVERTVTVSNYKDYEVLGITPPNSGAVLGLILNILNSKLMFCNKFCAHGLLLSQCHILCVVIKL